MGFIFIIIGLALMLRPRHYFGCGLFGPMHHRPHYHDFHDHHRPGCGPHGHGGMHGPMF
jgi:hypothetical protein